MIAHDKSFPLGFLTLSSPTQGVSSPSFGHAELRDHGAGHALHLLQVAPGARRDLRGAEDQLLRHTATKGSRNAGLRRRGDVGLGTDPITWIQLERELDKYGQRMCVTSLFLFFRNIFFVWLRH